jgi:putative phosphoesterase
LDCPHPNPLPQAGEGDGKRLSRTVLERVVEHAHDRRMQLLTGRSTLRVLLLADTHGDLDSRIATLARECDIAIHAGDVGNAAVLEALRAGGARVIAVRGNNDVPSKWPRNDRRARDGLEEVACIELRGGTLAVTHGDRYSPSTRHARLRAAFPDARAIVYGHSHRLIVDDSETPWILNPGAAGRARTYGGPSCLVLESSPRAWRVEAVRFERISAR